MRPEGGLYRVHPFEPVYLVLHSPVKNGDYPLPCVGRTKGYSMLKNSLRADVELEEVFGPQLSGRYAPARVDDVPALVKSFGNFATRDYDRSFVSKHVFKCLLATRDVTPSVSNYDLTPNEILGCLIGTKASGFLCRGSKYNFHKMYLHEMVRALLNPYFIMRCIPIYVIIPKEEIRDVLKDPRDLAFPPVWFTDFSVKYEKMFFLDTMSTWTESPIKVGIPIPQFWFAIIHWLTMFSTSKFISRFYMWDAKQFDRTHQIEVTISWYDLMQLKGAISSFAKTTEQECMDYINFWSCVRIVLLPDGRLVLVIAGIYSGDISTTNKNSYFHLVRLALCWLKCHGTLNGFTSFCRRSGLSLFGDDAVCAAHTSEHAAFLNKLPELWAETSGGILKVSSSEHLSEVSFLGRRALGDVLPYSLIPVQADMDRQLASLVFKNKPSTSDPLKRLSKLVAHRHLLAGFAYKSGEVTTSIEDANKRGLENLLKLDAVTRIHISTHSKLYKHDKSWISCCEQAAMDPKQLCAMLISGSDIPIPESLSSLPRGVILPMSLPSMSNMLTGNKNLRMSTQQTKSKKKKGAVKKSTPKKAPRAGNSLVNSGRNQRSGNSANTGPGPIIQKKQYSLPALNQATAAYGMSLMNPQCDDCNGAKVVSPIDEDSGVINSKVVLSAGCPSVPDTDVDNITYDQTGSGAFIARPGGLFMSYLYTPGTQALGWVTPSNEDPTTSPGLVVFSPANSGEVAFALNVGYSGTTSAAPSDQLYPNQNPSNPCWLSLPDCQMIQGLSSKKRVVSAGVEVAYTGPPITGSGQIAVGLVPWDMFNSTEMTVTTEVGAPKFYPAALTWAQFIQLEGVEVYPAIGGCHKTWYPYDASGTLYQESITTYVESENTALNQPPMMRPTKHQMKASLFKSGPFKKVVAKPNTKSRMRSTFDPELDNPAHAKKAFLTKRKSEKTRTPIGVDKKGQPIYEPESDSEEQAENLGASITSDFLLYDQYLGASYGIPFPMDGDQAEVAAFLSAIGIAGEFAAQAQGTQYQQRSQDDIGISMMETRPCQGQPLMVVMWNGVAPSNQEGLNPSWAANLFQITYYVNHEIIPDQNTFRIAEMPLSSSIGPASVGSPSVAIQAAKAVSPSGAGPLPSKTSTWKKFTNWVKGAYGTGKKIAGYVGKAAEIAEGVGDVLAAFV